MLEKERLLDNAYQYVQQCFVHLKALPLTVLSYSDMGDYLYHPPIGSEAQYKEVFKTLAAIFYMTKVQGYTVISGCNMVFGKTRQEKKAAIDMIKERGDDSHNWEGAHEGLTILFHTRKDTTQRTYRTIRDSETGRVTTLIHMDDIKTSETLTLRGLHGLIPRKEFSLEEFYKQNNYTHDEAMKLTLGMVKKLSIPIERETNWKQWFKEQR